MDIPAAVRNLWASQRKDESGELYDIQEIEGIGPLLVLTTWPDILRGSLWLHFIDNNGALSCLIKGSSLMPWDRYACRHDLEEDRRSQRPSMV